MSAIFKGSVAVAVTTSTYQEHQRALKMKCKLNVQFLVMLCLQFYRLIGVNTSYYSIKQRQVIRGRWWQVYTLFHNIALLCLMPYYFIIVWDIPLYATNPVFKFTNIGNAIIHGGITLFTVLNRWRHERSLLRITIALKAIEAQYFAQWQYPKQMDAWLIVKVVLVFLYNLSTLTIGSDSPRITTWETAAVIIFVIISLLILRGAIFHYYLGVWYICSRFEMLNVRVEEILRHASHCDHRTLLQLSTELRQLSQAHGQLQAQLRSLTDVYKYQLLCTLATFICTDITVSHYAIVMLTQEKHIPFLLGAVFSWLAFGNVLCLIWMCEHTVRTANAMLQRLSSSLDLSGELENSFAQSWELFTLQLVRDKLRIRLCWQLDLNVRQLFCIASQITLYVLCLIQIDYKNL